jgi:hypothetical protein
VNSILNILKKFPCRATSANPPCMVEYDDATEVHGQLDFKDMSKKEDQ